jgi:hypothetical protein
MNRQNVVIADSLKVVASSLRSDAFRRVFFWHCPRLHKVHDIAQGGEPKEVLEKPSGAQAIFTSFTAGL